MLNFSIFYSLVLQAVHFLEISLKSQPRVTSPIPLPYLYPKSVIMFRVE